ncbi:putative O-methyltransferase YrrM [Peptoclostridium acidaminophilum DSM 3953]|uniref:tRNA 5-hydroxyuridine methyltransferase n=1 Tax=Peptoclostridium acidaminophilum DSM 3953 TaxID=1286171 RepID=W8TFB5_PEPAC|nr:O-methyltransferase [Peptoclostridium acidaminophilum]AHM56518.1 putative O-methyltransferase YrrM [Peptoclostridium acidaminophilum DSM 3953]
MSNIVNEAVESYVRGSLKKSVGLMLDMEAYADEHSVPIVQKEVAQLINVILRLQRPRRILEVGTAIGYSAILMATASGEGCSVTTIERNPGMAEQARENIEKAGLQGSIRVIEEDATDALKMVDGEYDLIFMDAAKGQYMQFYDMAIDRLKTGGLLISDNILYKGMVASDEFAVRRKKTIIKRMRSYIDYICSADYIETSVIPIGDGVALSYKLKDRNAK